MDRGRRRRIRLRPELERESRVSLRRSFQQQFHHHRRAERLPFRIAARRHQLSLLIATRKYPVTTSRSLCGRDFLVTRALRRNHEVDRLRAFALLVRFDLECDTLSFGQILQPGSFHCGDVNEHIAAAIIGFDEAIAAFSIEELDRPSHGHRETPIPQCARRYALCAYRPTGHSLPESL